MDENNDKVTDGAVSDEVLADRATGLPATGEPQHHKNAKSVLIIVFVALLGIIAVLSFALIQGDSVDESANNETDTSEVADQEPVDQTEISSIPAGFVQYKNEDYGFGFSYPEEWGEAKIEDGREQSHLTAGVDRVIKFAGNPNVQAGFKSTDWKHDETGHDGIDYPGFINFEETAKQIREADYIDSKNVYRDDKGVLSYVTMCSEFCTLDHPKTLLKTMVQIDDEKVSGIEFFSYGDVLGQEYTDKQNVWDFDKIENADATTLFPKSDFRYKVIDHITDTVDLLYY